jgi:hypothetical protein
MLSALRFHSLCSHAGDLLTVAKTLHIRPPASPELPTRTLLHQKPPANRSQHSSAGSLPISATRANSMHSERATSLHFSGSPRHLLSPSWPAALPDIKHTVPKRYISPGNQLVGGVFLHLTRKSSVVSCSPHFSQKLSHACYYGRATGNVTPGMCTCKG